MLTVTTASGNKLTAQYTGEPAFELLPISPSTFVRRDQNVKYEFVTGATGSVAAGEDGGSSPTSASAASLNIVSGRGTNHAARVSAETLVPFELLLAGKVPAALDGYRAIKQKEPNRESVSEGRLNNLGYTLMRQNKLQEAIAVFKLNVEFYPTSANTYDSLGEAYMTKGDKELAIANYKKSLELDPGNANAAAMLKKLQ